MLNLSLKILLLTFFAPINIARNKRALLSRCASFTFEMREIKFDMREFYVGDARD